MKGFRTALVTGGNRGIGLSVVRQLSQKGIETLLASRDLQAGERCAKALRKEGLPVTALQLDVISQESIHKARASVKKMFGRLDILINNAAVYLDRDKNLHELKDGVFELTIATNLTGPLNLCRAFLPMMKAQGYGRIVNLTSGYGESRYLVAKVGAYKISKYAINGMTRILAGEVDGKKIKINSVCPGWVRTRMGGPSATRSPEEAAKGVVWAARLEEGGPSGQFFRDQRQVQW